MSKVTNLSIVVIAALLIGHVVFDRLVPMLTFEMTKGRYAEAVIECERARHAERSIGPGLTGDKRTDADLKRSVRVQLLSCLHQEVLKNKFLNWGVRESSIRSVELNVISATADLRYEPDRLRP
jgi:hypothetical protein